MEKLCISPVEDATVEGYGMECEQANNFFSITQNF